MASLSKSQQKFVLMFVAGAIGTLLGYLVNQVPGIPDDLKQQYPFWDKAVIGTVALLTVSAFTVAWRLLRLDGDEAWGQPADKQLEQSRIRLLERLRKTWIEGVLEKSLYHHARLELGLKMSSDTIHPWAIEAVKGGQQVTLPPGTLVIQQFDALGEGGSMVILGESGSGKTTILLELARDLLERSEQDSHAALPVVLHLAGWNRGYRPKQKGFLGFGERQVPPQSLADWVIEELEKSPLLGDLAGKDYKVDRKVGYWWLREEGRLVLLLDGLDEVAESQREVCAKAINEFRQDSAFGNVEVVVCCRVNDYKKLEAKLNFDEALLIQPLMLDQIEQYLKQSNANYSRIESIFPGQELQEFASQPLILWVLMLAFNEVDEDIFSSLNKEEKYASILDTYIAKQAFSENIYTRMKVSKRINQKISRIFIIAWFSALANIFEAESGTYQFSVNEIRFKWLTTIDLKYSPQLLKVILPTIKTVYKLFYILFIILVCLSLLFFLLSSLFLLFSHFFSVDNPYIFFAARIAIFSCFLFLFLFLFFSFLIDSYHSTAKYTKNIFRTSSHVINLINSYFYLWKDSFLRVAFSILFLIIRLTNITTLISYLVILFFIYQNFLILLEIPRYLFLKSVLSAYKIIPWNYRTFLDWACDRFILQKVGDSYIFIHRIIREHFSQMDIDAFMQWVEAREQEKLRMKD